MKSKIRFFLPYTFPTKALYKNINLAILLGFDDEKEFLDLEIIDAIYETIKCLRFDSNVNGYFAWKELFKHAFKRNSSLSRDHKECVNEHNKSYNAKVIHILKILNIHLISVDREKTNIWKEKKENE